MNSDTILVAGVGNVFFGDDGFGVAVARRLSEQRLPPGVTVLDIGIRGLHLAFALLEGPSLLVVADAVTRGQPPGSLYLLEPDGPEDLAAFGPPDPHGMDLRAVLASLDSLGGRRPRVLIVGCEPAVLTETLGLSPVVEAAVEPAAALIHSLVGRELGGPIRAAETQPGERP